MEPTVIHSQYDSLGRPIRSRRRPPVPASTRTEVLTLLHRMTGVPSLALRAEIDQLDDAEREILNMIASQILEDIQTAGPLIPPDRWR